MGKLVRRYMQGYNVTAKNRFVASVTRLVSETIDLIGLKATITVPTGVTITRTESVGGVIGARLIADFTGTGAVIGYLGGLLIEHTSAVGSTPGSVGYFGIWISNYHLGTTPTNYFMIRCQENGTAVIQTFFYLRCGSGGATYAFWLHGDTTAWQATGTAATQVGWIKCLVGGFVRYIALYSAVS